MMNRRTMLAASLAPFAGIALPAFASTWPDRPIKFIVPFPPGGGVDTAARIFGDEISKHLKQQVVIDNRPGASGAIGAQAAAKSAPDGYTFLVSSPAEVLVSVIAGQSLPYDPRKDLVPVALAGDTPLAIVAHPKVVTGGLQALIDKARAEKLVLNYGTPGNDSTMNFAGEALKAATGINWQHVPYRGAAPAVNDVLGGQIDVVISGLPPLIPHIKSGKLNPLAVTSTKRAAALPDVMAVAELPGLADFRFTNWMGVFAPAGTPADIVRRMAEAFAAAGKVPATARRLEESGLDPAGLHGAAFERFLADERTRYEKVRKTTGIHFE